MARKTKPKTFAEFKAYLTAHGDMLRRHKLLPQKEGVHGWRPPKRNTMVPLAEQGLSAQVLDAFTDEGDTVTT